MCIFTIYLQSCKERSGASSITIMKYVMKKYPSVEMDKKTKNLYKRALKRLVEKGTVKQVICSLTHEYFLFYIYTVSQKPSLSCLLFPQLKGKGFSGSFAIGKVSLLSCLNVLFSWRYMRLSVFLMVCHNHSFNLSMSCCCVEVGFICRSEGDIRRVSASDHHPPLWTQGGFLHPNQEVPGAILPTTQCGEQVIFDSTRPQFEPDRIDFTLGMEY